MPTTPGEATQAKIGYGTKLYYNANASSGSNASSGTFIQLAELTDIKPAKQTATPVEIQRYDAPTLFGEMITGWAKGGDIEATLVYTPDQSTAIFALFNTLCQFRIVKPTNTGWTYAGIMTEYGEEVPLKKEMSMVVKMTVSGAPTPYTGT